MKLLLDTNFLVDLCRFRIDLSEIYDLLSEPVELYVLNATLSELEVLSKKSKHGKYAKLSLELIKNSRITVLNMSGDVDRTILSLDKNFMVATNDGKLRNQLTRKGVKTIYLRARKHLAIG